MNDTGNALYAATRYADAGMAASVCERFNGWAGKISATPRYGFTHTPGDYSFGDLYADARTAAVQESRRVRAERTFREALARIPDDEPYSETLDMQAVNESVYPVEETFSVLLAEVENTGPVEKEHAPGEEILSESAPRTLSALDPETVMGLIRSGRCTSVREAAALLGVR